MQARQRSDTVKTDRTNTSAMLVKGLDVNPVALKAYRKPVLTLYGPLKTLTQSTASLSNGDGGQNMMV